ncbi:hypothetical protein HOLleu_25119 [Holothuria leucospilota]|uniref:Uncharacterized protein n=1 Tax=Holothuria leucospilota TaxID=206669 RepID=A0A9Q1BSL5_HOLLE|nr:hypothetical protein HOLleu_25119 [Holothuria leucospilota]
MSDTNTYARLPYIIADFLAPSFPTQSLSGSSFRWSLFTLCSLGLRLSGACPSQLDVKTMANLQRMIFPRGTTTGATFGQTTQPMEATEYCPSQVLEHILQPSLSSSAKPSNQLFVLSNPLPIPPPHLQSYDGRFLTHPNSSLALPIHLDVLPTQQYVASNSSLMMSPAPAIHTMSHNSLGTRPPHVVTSTAGMALLHATSGSVDSGQTVKFCSSSTIKSQSLMYSSESNPMKYKAAAQNCNVEERSWERFFRSPNLSPSRMLKHIDEKMSLRDKPSIQYTTDTLLDLSKKTTETLDRVTFATNETLSALNVSPPRSTNHADSLSVANYEYCSRNNITAIAKCVSEIVAATGMASGKDEMADSSSKVHERGNGIATNKTFTPSQDTACLIPKYVKRPPTEAEVHGQLVAGEVDKVDFKGTHRNTRSGIQKAQFSRHGQIKRSDKNLVCRWKQNELLTFFKSSRKRPIERKEFDLIKLADNSSDSDQWSLDFEKMFKRDDIDHQTEQSVYGSKSHATFDLEHEEEVKGIGCPDGTNLQRKESIGSVNKCILSTGESLEEDEGKDKRHKVESANIGTKMVENRSSYYYITPRNFSRKIKVRKSVRRLQKTKTEENSMKTHRCNTSVRNISIPLRDVSKLLSSARSGSQDKIKRKDPVDSFDKATCYSYDLKDCIKPFGQRVVLKKDKNMWRVIRSVSRKRNSTEMFGPPSNGKSKRLTANFKDDERNRTLSDDRSSFEKGYKEVVNQVRLSMKPLVTKGQGPSNRSASETAILMNTDSHSSQFSTPEEKLEENRHNGTLSVCVEGVQKPTNYSHLSAKEKIRFLRTRMRTSEAEVAKFLKK